MIKKFIIILIVLMTGIKSNASHFNYNWTYDKDLIDFYIKDNKDFILDNIGDIYIQGQKYKGFINYVLRKYEVPEEIFAIAAIESSYKINAKSHAGAIGMWQIMKPTGLDMGLIINSRTDDRRNWKKSSVSAIKYLKMLAEDHFDNDYELAILAYNAGLGNVKKSIKRMNNKNAWYLVKNDNLLKKESKEYLIKFIIYAYYFEHLDYNLNKIKTVNK